MKGTFVALLFLLCVSVYAQDTEVKVIVSAPETTVGVPVEFSVSVSSPHSGISLDLPEVRKYSAADLGIKTDPKSLNEEDAKLPLFVVEGIDVADLSNSGTFRKTIKVRVVYCAPGSYPIPPLAVKDGGKTAKFDSPRITVKPVNESGEAADIEPPLLLSGNHTRIIILVVAALLLGAAGYALWRRWRSVRRRPVSEPPARPAIEVFMEKAEAIEEYLSGDSPAPDYFALEVSMAFRRMISSLYGFDAAEMTSSEIVNSIVAKRKGLTSERYGASLEGIMALWDMTKFAEFTPSAETLRVNLSETVALAGKMWRDLHGI